jgi:hypothetical protein
MERENARAERMAAALSRWLEKGTGSQTDSSPHKAGSSTQFGIQGKTRHRPRQSPSKTRRRQETPPRIRKTTKGYGSNEIHQSPVSTKNSRKTGQQKVRQPDTPRLVLSLFRRYSPLVRSDSRGQESSSARRMVQGKKAPNAITAKGSG